MIIVFFMVDILKIDLHEPATHASEKKFRSSKQMSAANISFYRSEVLSEPLTRLSSGVVDTTERNIN